MFSKKKTVPVLPRSRFAKAKPNLKVLPKNSQQKEKKQEEPVSLNPKESDVSEIITPKIAEETVNNDNSEKSASLNQNESEVSEVVTPEVSDKTASINEFKNCSAEDKDDTAVGNVEKETAEEILPQDSALVDNPAEISFTVFSPVKAVGDTSIENNLPQEQHSTENETPEKFINSSPAKTSCVSSVDKSNKYPCITKLLSAPKKRSKNIEIRERKKMMASYKDLPPRSEMTFTDLIFWNPHTSPMKSKESKTSLLFNPKEKETNPVEEEEEEEEEEGSTAPKLFVNEDGEIILDESSLVVKRKKTSVDMTAEAIIIDDSNITYSSFRRRVSKLWTPKETVKFYKALSLVGTDFALMENIMPNRTRRELKIKFKKEEKINMELLQRAMYETETFQADLSVNDLNLDGIDIPGLEERIAKDLEGSYSKKQGKRKKNAEDSSGNNNLNENDPDYTEKKPRGRPKKVKERAASPDLPALHSTNDNFLIANRSRGRPRKIIDRSSNVSPVTENELFNVTETTPEEHNELDELSPLIRKRKVKVLSQDSLESSENATDDLIEIEVQIESSNKSQEQNTAVSRLSHTPTTAYDKSIILEKENILSESQINPEESPTVYNDEAMFRDEVSKEQLTQKTSAASLTKHDHTEKRSESHKNNNTTSEQPCANRKSKKVKINPNINPQKNKSVAMKETLNTFQNGCIPYPTSPSSIIQVTDETLLSDSVTDVVTSAHTRVSKKSKSTVPPYKSEQTNYCNPLQRLQLSSKNYTPVDEDDTDHDAIKKEKMFFNSISVHDEPVFFKNPNQRKYGSSETKEHLHKRKSVLPIPSSPLVDNVLNLNSSLVTSLNMSSKEPVTISMTPEQSVSEGPSRVMFMAQSPEGNRLHFYVANNFTGGLALPPQISVPPTNIVIKSEEENFNI